CRNVSSHHARFFQSPAVPGGGIGHPWLRRGTEHPSHGRIAQAHADHIRHIRRRYARAVRFSTPLFGLLEQGCDRSRSLHLEWIAGPVLSSDYWCPTDCLLYDKAGHLRLLREITAIRTGRADSARKPRDHDTPAHHSRGIFRAAGTDRHPCVAMVQQISQRPADTIRPPRILREWHPGNNAFVDGARPDWLGYRLVPLRQQTGS